MSPFQVVQLGGFTPTHPQYNGRLPEVAPLKQKMCLIKCY